MAKFSWRKSFGFPECSRSTAFNHNLRTASNTKSRALQMMLKQLGDIVTLCDLHLVNNLNCLSRVLLFLFCFNIVIDCLCFFQSLWQLSYEQRCIFWVPFILNEKSVIGGWARHTSSLEPPKGVICEVLLAPCLEFK